MFSSEFLQHFLIYIHVDNMPSKFLYLHYCRLNLFSVINVLVSKKLHVLLASVCNSWHSTPAEEKRKRKQFSIYSMFCTSADLPPNLPASSLPANDDKQGFKSSYFSSICLLNIHFYYTVKPTPCHPERLLIYCLVFGFKCPPSIKTRYKTVSFI